MFWGHNLKSGETYKIENKNSSEETIINITNASLNTTKEDNSKYTLSIIKNGESYQLCTLDNSKDTYSLNLTFQIGNTKLSLKGGNKGIVSVTGFLENFESENDESDKVIPVKNTNIEKEKGKESIKKEKKETPKKEKIENLKKESVKKEKNETPKKEKNESLKKEKKEIEKKEKEDDENISDEDLLKVEDEEEEEESEDNILKDDDDDDDDDDKIDSDLKSDEEENKEKFLGKKTNNDNKKDNFKGENNKNEGGKKF